MNVDLPSPGRPRTKTEGLFSSLASSNQEMQSKFTVEAARVYTSLAGSTEIAMLELKAAIREADKAGVNRTRISKLAGVSRQTVYTVLKEG